MFFSSMFFRERRGGLSLSGFLLAGFFFLYRLQPSVLYLRWCVSLVSKASSGLGPCGI